MIGAPVLGKDPSSAFLLFFLCVFVALCAFLFAGLRSFMESRGMREKSVLREE
jgi:hypothetical protein